jgi:hypothetical protein
MSNNSEPNGSNDTRIYFAFSFSVKVILISHCRSQLFQLCHISEYLLVRKNSLHPKACQVHHVTFILAESRHKAFLSAAPSTLPSKQKLSLAHYVFDTAVPIPAL